MLQQLGLETSVLTTALLVFVGTLVFMLIKSWWDAKRLQKAVDAVPSIGEVTLEELSKYDGRDPFLPLLFSVRGQIYDVSKGKDFYGPGTPLAWLCCFYFYCKIDNDDRKQSQGAGTPCLLAKRLPRRWPQCP